MTTTIKSSVIVQSGTVTLDDAGRFMLSIPPERLLSVTVLDTSYVCIHRYVSNGILVYVYTTDLNAVTTKPTISYTTIRTR